MTVLKVIAVEDAHGADDVAIVAVQAILAGERESGDRLRRPPQALVDGIALGQQGPHSGVVGIIHPGAQRIRPRHAVDRRQDDLLGTAKSTPMR